MWAVTGHELGAIDTRAQSRGFLTNELRVTSYELRVTIYCTSCELLFTTSYELLFIARITSYFLHTSYELLLIARFTS